jgi:hypothetical protein
MSTKFRGASGSLAWEWTNCKWGGAFHKKRATATETDRLLIAFMVVLLIWIWIQSRKFDLLLWHSNTWYFGEEDGSPLLFGCVARDMPLFYPLFASDTPFPLCTSLCSASRFSTDLLIDPPLLSEIPCPEGERSWPRQCRVNFAHSWNGVSSSIFISHKWHGVISRCQIKITTI